MTTFSDFDAVDYLTTETDIEAYLALVMADGDPELIAAAQDDFARAHARIQSRDGTLPGIIPRQAP